VLLATALTLVVAGGAVLLALSKPADRTAAATRTPPLPPKLTAEDAQLPVALHDAAEQYCEEVLSISDDQAAIDEALEDSRAALDAADDAIADYSWSGDSSAAAEADAHLDEAEYARRDAQALRRDVERRIDDVSEFALELSGDVTDLMVMYHDMPNAVLPRSFGGARLRTHVEALRDTFELDRCDDDIARTLTRLLRFDGRPPGWEDGRAAPERSERDRTVRPDQLV
jgi:hypothetical protein